MLNDESNVEAWRGRCAGLLWMPSPVCGHKKCRNGELWETCRHEYLLATLDPRRPAWPL